MSDYFRHNKNAVSFNTQNSWIVLTPMQQNIKSKIEKTGTQLRDWNIDIYRGILTGLNEAFIIDEKTKNKLISESPNSAEIIRPILRGREILKYGIEKNNQFLLFIPWHFPLHENDKIIGNSIEAENKFIEDYPAVYNHLLQFKPQLEKRNKAETGIRYEWYALQRYGSNYWKNFFEPKIIYPEITKFINFYLDEENYFTNNKCFIISGKNLEYLVSFLNSSLFKYCFLDDFPELLGGTRELRKIFFDKIPVKQVDDHTNALFKKKVSEVQLLKKENKNSKFIEVEIDNMIYDIYGLSEEERSTIGFIEIN